MSKTINLNQTCSQTWACNGIIYIWAVLLTQCNILLQLVKITILLSLSIIFRSTNVYKNFCATFLRFQPSRFQIWRQTEFLKNILKIPSFWVATLKSRYFWNIFKNFCLASYLKSGGLKTQKSSTNVFINIHWAGN